MVKLNMKCENCDNEYIKIDNIKTHDKVSLKNLSDYYDLTKPSEACECCSCKVYPEEIINYKEYHIAGEILKDKSQKPFLYFDMNNKIIPTNTMKLVGITLEGENENGKREAVVLDLSEENHKKLYNRAKDLWDKGLVSKYVICFVEDNTCFSYSRPDKFNFQKYYRMCEYMDKEHFFVKSKIINLPMDKYLKHIHIDEKVTSIPTDERSVDYEIS